MARKGIDLSNFKEFLFRKSELVGLGVTMAIALLSLGGWFLTSKFKPSEGKSYKEVLAKYSGDIRNRTGDRPLSDDEKKIVRKTQTEWDKALASGKPATPWWDQPPALANKRINPIILPIRNRPQSKEIQVDFVRAPLNMHKVDFTTKKYLALEAGKQQAKKAVLLQPQRMAIVTAIFPYMEQLEKFKTALRLAAPEEVYNNKDFRPKFLGLEVKRQIFNPITRKWRTNWEDLYVYDKKQKKNFAAPKIDKLLRLSILEADDVRQLPGYLEKGLATPVPKLAYYPKGSDNLLQKLDLAGVHQLPGMGAGPKQPFPAGPDGKGLLPGVNKQPGVVAPGLIPGLPGVQAGGGVKWTLTQRLLRELPKDLVKRLEGDYEVFDPFISGTKPGVNPGMIIPGQNNPILPQPNEDANDAGGQPGDPNNPIAGQPGFPNPMQRGVPDNLIVRFIDTDLKPGFFYQYTVRIRVENPNFKQHDKVENKADADVEVLYSPWVMTPAAVGGGEYRLYAYDQQPVSKNLNGETEDADQERVAVQIHKWVKSIGASEYRTVGDWLVAERVLIRRGDYIGDKVAVQAPHWDVSQGRFTLGGGKLLSSKKVKPRRGEKPRPPTVDVDFSPPGGEGAPILVDFVGGNEIEPARELGLFGKDRSGVELLIMGPDGSLQVRNSRDDANLPGRTETHEAWERRVKETQKSGPSGGQIENPFGLTPGS